MTESVKRLLQDENVLKVGLSLRDDFASLHKRGEFEPRAFLDLQDYVRAFWYRGHEPAEAVCQYLRAEDQ